jgi:uncharacterized circularly permuted ATP-grasp superfamily protein
VSTCYGWSTIVLKDSSYLYFFDESFCHPLHSLRLLVDGDLLVADVMVSMSTADIYMLVPVLWVPLDFLDDVVITLCSLLGTGLLML